MWVFHSVIEQEVQGFRDKMGSHFRCFGVLKVAKIPISARSHFNENESASFQEIPIFETFQVFWNI